MSREDLVKTDGGETSDIKSWLEPGSTDERGGDELVELYSRAAQEIETAWQPLTGARPASVPAGDWAEYHLPHGYNQTRIVLLVRDPFWLYSYWEIGAAERDLIRGQTGKELWEMPIVLRLHDLTDRERDPGMARRDIIVGHEARHWYLETDRPGHSFQAELGVDVPGQGFVSLAASNIVQVPTDRISEVLDEDWMIVEEDFRRLYRLATGLGPGHSSVEMMESLSRRLMRGMGSGAVSSLGSGFRPPEHERRFWLMVGTELVVYGATQPDARVTVDGTPVALRPDGTFTTRFALPDGERAIPVVGTAGDGTESITIVPYVRKETH